MNKIYYIVKDRDRDLVLPYPYKNKSRTTTDLTKNRPPRLFSRKGDATQAISWWKQGAWYIHRKKGDLMVTYNHSRTKYNLEVICVELKELR